MMMTLDLPCLEGLWTEHTSKSKRKGQQGIGQRQRVSAVHQTILLNSSSSSSSIGGGKLVVVIEALLDAMRDWWQVEHFLFPLTLSSIPVQECFTTKHEGELFPYSLPQLLDGSGVAHKGG